MKSLLLSIPFLAALLVSPPVLAKWQFSMGGGLRHARMIESDIGGRQLVHEHGWLPGIALNANRQGVGNWDFAVSGEVYEANLAYNGRLQNGVPFKTDSATTQTRISAELAHRFNETTSLLGALEYDEWRRHVLGHGGVAGVAERYSSWRLLAGAKTTAIRIPVAAFELKGLLVLARPERLRVHFDNQIYDDARLSTRQGAGLRIALTAHPHALPKLAFGLDLDWLQIRHSADYTLYRNGSPAGIVAQPEHERGTIGFHIDYLF